MVDLHCDATQLREKVLIFDDLMATGGTAKAAILLVERLGGQIIGCAFIVNLPELGDRNLLEFLGIDVHALCAFNGL